MKVRSGFVSNSSSSSFILVGKKISKGEVKAHKDVWLVGNELCEGSDIFRLDDEAKDIIESHDIRNCSLYAAFKVFDDDYFGSEFHLGKDELLSMAEQGGIDVVALERDHHDSFDSGDWKEEYII